MRHSEFLSRVECEVKLNGALNHAEHLRHRAQQVLHDAENEIVEFQNQSKKSMDDVVVAAAAVNDIALAENDGTIREILQLQAVTMISLAESDYRESRNSIDQLCHLAEMSSSKLYKRADRKSEASFKLFERRVQLISRQQKEKEGGTI
jgi:protoporphyrinogen oxidase